MNFKGFLASMGGSINKHAPLLLMLLGTAAEVAAVVSATKAEHKAQEILNDVPEEHRNDKDVKRAVAKCYIPAVGLTILGAGCNGFSWAIGDKRTKKAQLNAAAYASAYAVATTTADALRAETARLVPDKVEEIENAVKDKVPSAPVIDAAPEVATGYIPAVKGEDDILCKCINNGHYFWSNANKIGRAENVCDAWLASGTRSVSEEDYFLELTNGAVDVGTEGVKRGWTDSMSVSPGKYLDIGFGSELLGGKPVLTFAFRNEPVSLDFD